MKMQVDLGALWHKYECFLRVLTSIFPDHNLDKYFLTGNAVKYTLVSFGDESCHLFALVTSLQSNIYSILISSILAPCKKLIYPMRPWV